MTSLLGSQFSPAFADVILVTDAITLSIVLLIALYGALGGACSWVRHHLSTMLAFLMAHLRPRL